MNQFLSIDSDAVGLTQIDGMNGVIHLISQDGSGIRKKIVKFARSPITRKIVRKGVEVTKKVSPFIERGAFRLLERSKRGRKIKKGVKKAQKIGKKIIQSELFDLIRGTLLPLIRKKLIGSGITTTGISTLTLNRLNRNIDNVLKQHNLEGNGIGVATVASLIPLLATAGSALAPVVMKLIKGLAKKKRGSGLVLSGGRLMDVSDALSGDLMNMIMMGRGRRKINLKKIKAIGSKAIKAIRKIIKPLIPFAKKIAPIAKEELFKLFKQSDLGQRILGNVTGSGLRLVGEGLSLAGGRRPLPASKLKKKIMRQVRRPTKRRRATRGRKRAVRRLKKKVKLLPVIGLLTRTFIPLLIRRMKRKGFIQIKKFDPRAIQTKLMNALRKKRGSGINIDTIMKLIPVGIDIAKILLPIIKSLFRSKQAGQGLNDSMKGALSEDLARLIKMSMTGSGKTKEQRKKRRAKVLKFFKKAGDKFIQLFKKIAPVSKKVIKKVAPVTKDIILNLLQKSEKGKQIAQAFEAGEKLVRDIGAL
ncbi:MAG TPA: hypothetical protein ENG48_12335 [Candidatus Atribacteria bacterium]|nr:hypothetical protein [Candidatus Atribacteria bacterium]